ncbi:ATP-grasp ribosomal peptide maturase [Actinomadura formosensis]|uniref:ATP-grasp ribosomal peptide maturase n=2 Tax=Actinomadura formosensis TaxID=60706 RepID=UPI0008360A5C|nr:ATP-grasp ribosomal peptide maturase [Actinomadura formosensis]
MTVLMLAHDTDEVAGQVAAELRTRGTEVARLNPSAFPSRLTMGARLRDSGTWGGLISGEDGPEVELAGIRAVWQRRASPFVMDERMSSPERAFAYGEARRGFGGVLTSLACCLWVNDPVAAARAAYKPLQLAQAAEVGLAVPATLITSEPRTAYNWAKELRRPIVYKPMNGVAHADEGQVRVVFTAPVADLESLLDPAFGLTAQMLQERVPKAFEARVTVVGSEMFAVRIDAGSTAAQEDWRSDYDALSYSIIELPPDLRAKLLKLMARLGLVYGAFDLIHDTSGRWVFLEVNQGGEFGWIADETGLPIYSAIADLLEKAHDEH